APLTNAKHFFWAPGQNPAGTVADSASNELSYHGGSAGSGAIGGEAAPDGKLYSSKTLQTYLNSFFNGVGGSGWANIQTQYCNAVLPGATSCVGGSGFVGNPR